MVLRVGAAGNAVRVPGDVGGRANGTELTECAPRLCVLAAECDAEREDGISGVRVFVKVIVTEKGSPAKYEACEGVTTTRIASSWEVAVSDILVQRVTTREQSAMSFFYRAIRWQIPHCFGVWLDGEKTVPGSRQ